MRIYGIFSDFPKIPKCWTFLEISEFLRIFRISEGSQNFWKYFRKFSEYLNTIVKYSEILRIPEVFDFLSANFFLHFKSAILKYFSYMRARDLSISTTKSCTILLRLRQRDHKVACLELSPHFIVSTKCPLIFTHTSVVCLSIYLFIYQYTPRTSNSVEPGIFIRVRR